MPASSAAKPALIRIDIPRLEDTLMKLNRLAVIVTLMTSAPTFASDFGMAISTDAVRADYSYSIPSQPVNLSAGYTYHEDGRNLLDLGFHAQGQTAMLNMPTTAGVGFLAMGFTDDDTDESGMGLGLGGYVRFNIPQLPGLSVGTSLHYAPSVLSFGDADGMLQTDTSISYRVIRNAEVGVGYRFYKTEFENGGELTLDEGGYLGLKLYF